MVALVAGNSLGLNLTSLATLGARGVAGNAALGRGTDRVTVNVANGNLILQNQDDTLAGSGLWSASQRTYNSQEHLAGDFRLPGLQPPRLATFGAIGQRNSSIVRKDADGSEDRYAYDATRRLYLSTSGAGAYDTIRYRNNQLVWTDGDTGTTEYYARYQDQWQLVRRQDTDGNALAFLYNQDGQVQSVANNSGETVYYDYRIDGAVGNGIGNANGNGNGNGKPGAAADITQYVYDAFGRLLQTISPNGGVISYAYDGLNRLLAMQDAEGNLTATRYDDANRRTTLQSANGLHTVSAYDAAGRLTSLMQTDVSGQPLAVTTYDYDADGRLRHSTDPTGVERWMLYDDADRLVAEIDGNRSLVEYVYNRNNQLLHTIRYATPVAGDLQAVLSPNALAALRPMASAQDSRTWRLYDAANRLVGEIDAEGLLTRTEYDGASRVVRTTAYANAIDVSTLTAQTTLAQLQPAASADDRITRRLYDNDGLLRATLDAEGYVQEWRYDAAGQQVAQIRYATATDPALRSSGALSQLRPAASSADILGQRIYNARGQLTAEIDGEGYLTSHRYDGNGNRTGSTRHARALTDTQRAMLVAGGIASAWRPEPGSTDGIQTWCYDLLDRLIASTDYSGTVTRYQYDSMGRLVQTTLAAGSDEARTQTRRYDLQGSLLAELSGEGNAALAALANPSSEQIEAIWQQHAMRYQYDAAGRLLTRTDANGNPIGKVISYAAIEATIEA